MVTQRGKLLIGLVGGFLVVVGFGSLSYNQYLQQKQINSLVQPAIVRTVVVTPTTTPTATPSATRIFTPAKAVNPVATKGAVAK